MSSTPVKFTQEKETMLLTLYGRALQSRAPHPLLRDPWAEQALQQIDYDYSRLQVSPRSAWLIACRAAQLDQWTAAFLAEHPAATVLHLGCGLDSRCFRVSPPAGARWYDVDYPEVIDLRRRLYPERPGYHLIGASLADLAWLADVPAGQPALMVAEGVTMYLTEPVVQGLLQAVVNHFPGGQMVFDAHTPQLIGWLTKTGNGARGTGATFHWGLDDPRDLQRLEPRLEWVAQRQAHQLSAYSQMPANVRALVRVMDLFPALRTMRCLLYRFGRL